jgi:hypothetical protein
VLRTEKSLLVFLTFDRDFLTGLVIKVDFFPALFLDQRITRQVLLHLIRSGPINVDTAILGVGGISKSGLSITILEEAD